MDYVVQVGTEIVPIEAKGGASGALKSLHQFMYDKRLSVAVRCDANPPSRMRVDLSTTRGQPVAYELISLPLYLCWRLADILAEHPEVLGRPNERF